MSVSFPNRKLRVATLMGGTSNERAVSLSTGKMIRAALDTDRYEVIAIDTKDTLALVANSPTPLLGKASEPTGEALVTTRNALPANIENFGGERPDVVFIALHGKGGEDGTIQGMLDLLGIPYTGSGVLASALAMNKSMSKRLFRSAGIPVAEEIVVWRNRPRDLAALQAQVETELGGYPVFVKPNAEGSTFGCTLVNALEELEAAIETALRYDSVALIERYLRGMEITAGVLEDADAPDGLLALPLIEIIPKSAYYDYESKYAEGGSEHIIPARLSEERTQRAQEFARQCHTLLGCRGMSRTDFIATEDGLYVLEVNTIPGMTPTSLLPQAADHAGISFPELLDRLIASALA